MVEKQVFGLINGWVLWALKISFLTSLFWLNTKRKLLLKYGHHKYGIWSLEETWMTGKFPEWLNFSNYWRVSKESNQVKTIYRGMGTTKEDTGWKKDKNKQILGRIKTSNGLGSKFGESKCHKKWHASPGCYPMKRFWHWKMWQDRFIFMQQMLLMW